MPPVSPNKGKVACTGPDCPLCKQFPPTHVQVVVKDPKTGEEMLWSMPIKLYNRIREVAHANRTA